MVASITHAFVNPKGDTSDPTITRPSDWNAQHVVTGVGLTGKQCVPIAAANMIAEFTNGSQAGGTGTAGNSMLIYQIFSASTIQAAQVFIPMPDSWDEGAISFKPVWTHPSTTTNFGVVWELSAVACGDGDLGSVAFGTGQNSVDTGGVADTIYIGPESAAVTVAGTPQEGDLVTLRIRRLPAHASDTLAVEARLIGIKLFLSTSEGNDA